MLHYERFYSTKFRIYCHKNIYYRHRYYLLPYKDNYGYLDIEQKILPIKKKLVVLSFKAFTFG